MTLTNKLHASENHPDSERYTSKDIIEIVDLVYGFDGFISTYTEILGNRTARYRATADRETWERTMNRFYEYYGKMQGVAKVFEKDKGNRFHRMLERIEQIRKNLEELSENKNRTYKNQDGEVL